MLLADGFEEIEAITPLDILRRAGADILTVGIGGEWVTGAHDITVRADITPDGAKDDFDMLILPGGMPGTDNLQQSDFVTEMIIKACEKGSYVAAICAAPKILGQMGVLNGREAVCFPGYEDCLTGAHIADKPVVVDGNIITAEGAGAAADFGFALAGLLYGEEKAKKLRSKMRYYG